ncbi:Molybdopterin converting factor, small subunit [Geoalkalibacter ferrihydriticus]|uniref:Molybdenum cofactor biosynthesis protein MoaD n=2 Tax=Geoalkalibacter ferrihydriticus TaxID=392333 RepID=A0A0C2E9W0_9BACT|nr:MoaD/ThiS family protein [Geoalkalibacter ferrihydriticus]KIH75363.1 molybdenum cofactor biosynthesis protein MoaD [Geoalkalibacter ferrihydriticus DSM 17813]SDM96132.1 Molybdopterin converting factor, small subunit [Geoalkalibacter ferrihydriticus]
MKVLIKLFATFRNERFKQEEKELPEGTTIRQVVAQLEIAEEALGMVMVNGRHAPLESQLHEGDTLALFPLVGGG